MYKTVNNNNNSCDINWKHWINLAFGKQQVITWAHVDQIVFIMPYGFL